MLLVACAATPEGPQDGGANEVDAGAPIEGDAALTLDGSAADADVSLDAAMPAGRCVSWCAAGEAPGPQRTEPARATFLADVAAATCRALFRCCAPDDAAFVFGPVRADGAEDWPLAAFRSRLPPEDADFTEDECRSVLAEVYAVRPFGSWLAEVDAGRVGFDVEGHAACLGALEGASCGAEVQAALTDGTCFAFSPPEGGEAQRRMFARNGGVGAPCRPIDDGVGARLYGSCDPTAAFCCFARPDVGSECWLSPSPDAVGTCRAVAPTGGMCNFIPRDFQLCATGSSCSLAGRCEVERLDLPQVGAGAPCFEGTNFTADCGPDAFCDALGSGACVALREVGEACDGAALCRSRRCR